MSTAEAIARTLGLRRAGREFAGRCPSCGYKTGFTVAERGDAILLYCHAGGCTQAALWRALDQAGIATRASRDRCAPSKRRDKLSTPANAALGATGKSSNSQAAALAVWQRSRPASGTAVETYVREARGYTGPIPPVLRYALGRHPSDPKRRHPMMVAAVMLADRIVAVHRTFLRPDGRGKADLAPDKMTLGPCKGAAAPLAPAGPVLAIAEGIESALGYMRVSGTPTWAALSAVGIRNLVLPGCVQHVVIAADPDPVGIMAAHAAARLWLGDGRRVSIARPPLGRDFNDVARAS